MYILQYFYCKAGISVRRLVLLAMKKYFNVPLDGRARQQKNVIEMGVREQGAKARLCVGPTSFWRRVVRSSRCHQAWLRCVEHVFRQIPRTEWRCRGRKTVEKSFRASPSVHHCTVAQSTPSAGGRGVVRWLSIKF